MPEDQDQRIEAQVTRLEREIECTTNLKQPPADKAVDKQELLETNTKLAREAVERSQ